MVLFHAGLCRGSHAKDLERRFCDPVLNLYDMQGVSEDGWKTDWENRSALDLEPFLKQIGRASSTQGQP